MKRHTSPPNSMSVASRLDNLPAIAALVLAVFSTLPSAAHAQLVFGASYSLPSPISAAPGQIMTVFVQGIGSSLVSPVSAATIPLPTTLAGISAVLTQSQAPVGPIPVPLLYVAPVGTCPTQAQSGCATFTLITLQVPFELYPPHGSAGGGAQNSAYLEFTDSNGTATVELAPAIDSIHVLREGDTLNMGAPAGLAGQPLVTHSDGTLVTAASPATSGETVVIYAVGLGPASPPISTGAASPAPPATAQAAISFNFQPDATPSRPIPGLVAPQLAARAHREVAPDTAPALPGFVGLTPGLVGLYQLNVLIPAIPSGYSSQCGADARFSNLTINVGGLASFDGAQVCVAIGG